MGVTFTHIDVRRTVRDKRQLKKWILEVVKAENRELGCVSIALCSDSYIVDANVQFLGHSYPTDIITFDYCEGKIVSGDLLISADTVAANAKLWGATYDREMARVIIHGVLHLCGYGDKSESEQKIMRAKEDFSLDLLKSPNNKDEAGVPVKNEI